MQTRIELFLLTSLAWPLAWALAAEEPPTAPSPQNLQDSQQRLGEQIGRLGESLEELLEEAQTNLGVELQDFDTFRHTRERLADLSDRQMPSICSDLREPTTKALYTAWRRQQEIAGELNHLLLSVRRHLAPAMSRRVLGGALERQKEALEQTRDLRTAYPELEGLPAEALTEDQQRALSEAAEAQAQAAEDLARTQAEMQRQYEALAGGDLSAREMLRRAEDALERTNIPAQATEAVEDLKQNHMRQAEEKQEGIIRALKAADEGLAPPADPASRTSERLSGLQEAVGQQAQALDETSHLEKGSSEQDLIRAARDQGEVSRQLQKLTDRQPDLKPIQADSETAKQKLVDGDLASARQAQEKALKALQEALQEAAGELARAERLETRSAAATLELDQIRALLRRQEELLSRTRRVPAERAHALAREQTELAHSTGALASAERPRPPKGPPIDKLVEMIGQLAEQAKQQSIHSAESAEKHLAEIRQTIGDRGDVSEELDPETFYAIREMSNQAQEQLAESRRAAQEADSAAVEVAKLSAAIGSKRAPGEARPLALALAGAALRAVAACGRSARSDEQRQRAALLQSQALQTAAWLQTEGLPGTTDSLKSAERAMTLATTELANQQPTQAVPRQVDARAALEAALCRLMAELGQSDLATVIGLLRDGTASLAESQSRLTAETARADAAANELKPRQDALKGEAERLRGMPALPGEAAEALTRVASQMQRASSALQQSQINEAQKAQSSIDEALAHALYALREAAAAAQLAPTSDSASAKGDKQPPKKKDLPPVIEATAPPPSANAPAWEVALPPKERAEVNQALKEKMPARYRQQIARYYENLARVGLE